MKRSESCRPYSGLVVKAIWGMLSCLLCLGLARAQDESGQALRRAVELHQSGHYAEAITGYQAYLKAHPEAVAVRSNLGAALAHEGRYTEAIQEYEQLIRESPKFMRSYSRLAELLLSRGDVAGDGAVAGAVVVAGMVAGPLVGPVVGAVVVVAGAVAGGRVKVTTPSSAVGTR